MPILTLTVARIDPPRPNGGKNGKIVGTSGETIYAPPSKTAKFIPGHSYEVDYSTSEWKGQNYNNLESFHEVEASKASSISAPQVRNSAKDEQIWVQGLLQAMIKAGKVEVDKQALWSATQMLRGLWRHTFGFDSVHQHLEAAE